MANDVDITRGNVRAELARRQIAQGDLSPVLGITQAAISRRLSGRTPFSLTELELIAARLGVSIDLLTREN